MAQGNLKNVNDYPLNMTFSTSDISLSSSVVTNVSAINFASVTPSGATTISANSTQTVDYVFATGTKILGNTAGNMRASVSYGNGLSTVSNTISVTDFVGSATASFSPTIAYITPSSTSVTGTYMVNVTNNTGGSSTLNFAASDLSLSGITNAASASISVTLSSLTLANGATGTVSYSYTISNSSTGTLSGSWSKSSLSATATKTIGNSLRGEGNYSSSSSAFYGSCTLAGGAATTDPELKTYLTDGNYSTNYVSADYSNAWLEIDLGTAHTITRIAVAGGSQPCWSTNLAGYLNGQIVQYYNEGTSSWVDIWTVTGTVNTATTFYDLSTPITASKVRLYRNSWLLAGEFYLFGYEN